MRYIENSEVLGLRMGQNGQMERSIFDQNGPTEKSDPPFEVDLNRKFENFGWMDRAQALSEFWTMTRDASCSSWKTHLSLEV